MPHFLRFIMPGVAAMLVATLIAACAAQGSVSTATAAGASSNESTAAQTSTVSANSASRDEVVAALSAAGVANADRWAAEIMEYRPYDTADPTLQHLQDELAKYNPDDATLAAILSVLVP